VFTSEFNLSTSSFLFYKKKLAPVSRPNVGLKIPKPILKPTKYLTLG
jgi:hypothetical protein